MKDPAAPRQLIATLEEYAAGAIPPTWDRRAAIRARVAARLGGRRWRSRAPVVVLGLLLLLLSALLVARGGPPPAYDGIAGLGPPRAAMLPGPPGGASDQKGLVGPLPLQLAPTTAWSAQTQDGVFRVVVVLVRMDEEVQIFYAMRGTHRGVPQAEARRLEGGPGGVGAPGALRATEVQALGPLADWDTGVIHVPWGALGAAGLRLEITPPVGAPRSWQVVPISRVGPNPYGGHGTRLFATAPPALNQVSVACSCGPEGFRLALLGRAPQQVPPIPIAIDADGSVRVLAEAAWRARWPVPPGEDLEHPYIAPTYAATATWDPAAPTGTPALPPPPPTGSAP